MEVFRLSILTEFLLFIYVFWLNIGSVFSEWNTRDYLKKEHSLIKPYSGTASGLTRALAWHSALDLNAVSDVVLVLSDDFNNLIEADYCP